MARKRNIASDKSDIDALLNIDLKAAIMGSILAKRQMETQSNGGYIYSDDENYKAGLRLTPKNAHENGCDNA